MAFDNIRNLFDVYTFNARIKPALVIIFPIFLIILIWFPETRESYNTFITILISFGIISLLSNYFATAGRNNEKLLFQKFGGIPTTIMLSHNDLTIDKITKKRYHLFLSKKLSIDFPTLKQENDDLDTTKEIYDSAIRFLRKYSRDKNKYPLVFKENVNYGFARNLYSSKKYGIIITLLSLVLTVLMFYSKYLDHGIDDIAIQSFFQLDSVLSVIGIVTYLFIWLHFINLNWVKERAFAYARALLEVCELETEKSTSKS